MAHISRFLILFSLLLVSDTLPGQIARLQNSSFEGEPRDATVPRAWHICKEGSTPDILPGYWGVYLEADEGDTYVGLISRENGTWEDIGQRLPVRLTEDRCYTISFSLAHSDSYSDYNGSLRLRVWGGKSKCEMDQLLFETPVVDKEEWTNYEYNFKVKDYIQYMVFEAYYKDPPFAFKGNILLDNISVIRPCTGS